MIEVQYVLVKVAVRPHRINLSQYNVQSVKNKSVST